MERKSPSLKVLAGDRERFGVVIDLQRAGAADADLAHLPGDERRVAELTPPRAVRMPSAAIMPRKSSGDVSMRTSRTFSPPLAASTARSALK